MAALAAFKRSLIRNEPTSASVSAGASGASFLFLHRNYFERLIEAVPELRGYFEKLSANRLTDLRSRAPEVENDEVEVELLF